MPFVNTCHAEWLCGHCGTKQSVYTGDPEDLTIPDVEAVRCYQCKKVELTTDDDEFCISNSLYASDDANDFLPVTQELIEEYANIEEGVPV